MVEIVKATFSHKQTKAEKEYAEKIWNRSAPDLATLGLPKTKKTKNKRAKREPGVATKKARAVQIFKRVGGLKNPAIMAFITELDMTKAGATSYFYAIKAGK